MNKKKVGAVYDADLLEMLEHLGLKNKFENEMLKCSICGEVITWHNLHLIYPDSGDIKFCCMNPKCINTLIAKFK